MSQLRFGHHAISTSRQGRLHLMLLVLAIVTAGVGTGEVNARGIIEVLRAPEQSSAGDFSKVAPGREFSFPQDHLPHTGYRIEWWYITANLQDRSGRDWGLQWTLFRTALAPEQKDPDAPVKAGQTAAPAWESPLIWMAHAAISSPEGHHFEERFARGGTGQANVARTSISDTAGRNRSGPIEAWLDDWRFTSQTSETLFPADLVFEVDGLQAHFTLSASGPQVLQGRDGYSPKSSDGQASYYYSQPFIEISGAIGTPRSGAESEEVKLSGKAWLDREWSSSFLGESQAGWDWLSLHLDDDRKLMIFQLRTAEPDGEVRNESKNASFVSGSLIDRDGTTHLLTNDDILIKPGRTSSLKNGVELPLEWTIELPGRKLAWKITTDNSEQYMNTAFPYWEGTVRASGKRKSPDGIGYMELTGYATELGSD